MSEKMEQKCRAMAEAIALAVAAQFFKSPIKQFLAVFGGK